MNRKRCTPQRPGCKALTEEADGISAAAVPLKVGPVKARFRGMVTPDRSAASDGFTLPARDQGQGGSARFACGGAQVHLDDPGDATLLRQDAGTEIGSWTAQASGRLIRVAAGRMATLFFANLWKLVVPRNDQPG